MSKFSSDGDLDNQSQICNFHYFQPFKTFQSDKYVLSETYFPMYFVLSYQLLLSCLLRSSSHLASWTLFSLKNWSVNHKTHWNLAMQSILVATYICSLNNLIWSHGFINNPNAHNVNVYVIGHQFCSASW